MMLMDNVNQQIPSQQPVTPPTGSSKLFPVILVIVLLVVVGVGAYILGKGQTNIAENQQGAVAPTAIPTSTSIPDETASWKTLKSSEYGFTIQYPSTVFHETTIDSSAKVNKSHEFFKVNGGSLEIYGLCQGRGISPIKTKDVVIAGINTSKYYETETQGVIKSINIPNSNEQICFNFILPKDQSKEAVDSLFDQILSTFQFSP